MELLWIIIIAIIILLLVLWVRNARQDVKQDVKQDARQDTKQDIATSSPPQKFKNVESCILYWLAEVEFTDEQGRAVGYKNSYIVERVRESFPRARTTVNSVAFYRSRAKRGYFTLPDNKKLPMTQRNTKQGAGQGTPTPRPQKFKNIESCILYWLAEVEFTDEQGRAVGYKNSYIVERVRKSFPRAKTTGKSVSGYRSKVKRGLITLPDNKKLPMPQRDKKQSGTNRSKRAS
jgi:hypothetical protein